ncbi:MAG: HAD family hydrolase, partial [Chloroflexi bacterium]|nr:HAD family hydrolase [Chloroflexota bacterium]
MLRGLIFDLGSTLIYNQHNNQWSQLRPRLVADLVVDLKAQGLTFDNEQFTATFIRNIEDFDQQRQTHFKEITTEYILRVTFKELNIQADHLNLPRALAALFSFSESQWQPMPHVHPTLRLLQERGLKLAIVSNAADSANVQRLIDNAHLRSYFDPIIISANVGVRKPNPRIFDPVLKTWGFIANEVVVIGDTLGADILGAKNAHIKSIWVTMQADTPYNAAHRDTIVPDAICDSLDQLPAILQQIADG